MENNNTNKQVKDVLQENLNDLKENKSKNPYDIKKDYEEFKEQYDKLDESSKQALKDEYEEYEKLVNDRVDIKNPEISKDEENESIVNEEETYDRYYNDKEYNGNYFDKDKVNEANYYVNSRNQYGWYFNPEKDRYDPEYNPLEDTRYNKTQEEKKPQEKEEKATVDEKATLENYYKDLSNYKGNYFNKENVKEANYEISARNQYGWYFNPEKDRYDPEYNPLKDPKYNGGVKIENKEKEEYGSKTLSPEKVRELENITKNVKSKDEIEEQNFENLKKAQAAVEQAIANPPSTKMEKFKFFLNNLKFSIKKRAEKTKNFISEKKDIAKEKIDNSKVKKFVDNHKIEDYSDELREMNQMARNSDSDRESKEFKEMLNKSVYSNEEITKKDVEEIVENVKQNEKTQNRNRRNIGDELALG